MKPMEILLPSFCLQLKFVQDEMLRSANKHINNNGIVVVTEFGNEMQIQFINYEELREHLANYCSNLNK